MSFSAALWALKQKTKTSGAKNLLMAMSIRANKKNECFPSVRQMIIDTGICEKSVTKHITELKLLNYINDTGQRTGRTLRTKIYRLNIPVNMEALNTVKNTGIKKDNTSKNTGFNTSKNAGLNTGIFTGRNIKGNHKRKQIIKKVSKIPKSSNVWESYSSAYKLRYNHVPIRNASINSMLCKLVDYIGEQNAIDVANYYLHLNRRWFIQNHHPVNLLLQNYQSVYTEMMNQSNMTNLQINQEESTNHNISLRNKLRDEFINDE